MGLDNDRLLERYRKMLLIRTIEDKHGQLLAEGKSNKDVAVALGVSVKTVDAHRANVMHKLNLHSVTELVRYAVRNQLIEA